ncbi:Uncharacterised protein [Klebsiella pneumoniae]|nr:Uncharacterised protein [Klebsiella pneumoniae]
MNPTQHYVHHFHGTPIWGGGGEVHRIAVAGAGAFVSDYRPDQLAVSLEHAITVGLDNGAYSAWKKEIHLDWGDFYYRLDEIYDNPKLGFFVIPDVIVGGERENDALIKAMPLRFSEKAAPTWHLHESINRLIELCRNWPRVCFGSSGQYAVIRTKHWHARMKEAFTAIYVENNFQTKIHGLRMLDGRVLGNYPLDSADSTNLACNIPKFDCKYPEITRTVREADYSEKLSAEDLKALILKTRCAILKNTVEKVTPPSISEWVSKGLQPYQLELAIA